MILKSDVMIKTWIFGKAEHLNCFLYADDGNFMNKKQTNIYFVSVIVKK